MADLLESINRTWVQQSPFVWCERIVNSTAQLFDRAQRLQGIDFLSDLLRLGDEAREDDAVMAEMCRLLSDNFGQGRLSRYLKADPPSKDEFLAILTAAEALCLSELLVEEAE